MKSQTQLKLAAICGVPLVMVLGNSMLIPVFPKIKSLLDISQVQVGLIITLFSIPAGIFIPIAGFISDRTGRKTVIVPGLIIYGLGGLISGLASALMDNPFYLLLAGRIIQGIGAAGTAPVAMALVGDIFTTNERSKALGILEASNGLGKVLSPILGSLTALIIWYEPFFLYTALCIPIAILVWLLVKEDPKQIAQRQQSLRKYFKTFTKIFKRKKKSLLSCFLGGAVALFILFGVLVYLSDILEIKYKIEGVLKGSFLAIPVLVMCTTSYLSGTYLQNKYHLMKYLIAAGFALAGGALFFLPFFPSIYIFFIGVSIIGLGCGLALPSLNTLITSSCAKEERGLVTCLYGSVRFFGVALGPPVFGALMEYGRYPTFFTAAVISVLTAIITFFFLNTKEMIPDKLFRREN